MKPIVIDVRERDEFEAEHVANSIHLPLSTFASVAPGVLAQLPSREITLLCRSGNRARLAAAQMAQMGFADTLKTQVYAGGMQRWKQLGGATITRRRGHLPLMRQVQLIAGVAVLTGTALGVWVHPGFLGVTAFFGAGLTLAGATGFCGMALLLARMPWNHSHTTASVERC